MPLEIETLEKLTPGYIIAFFATGGAAFTYLKELMKADPINVFLFSWVWGIIGLMSGLTVVFIWISEMKSKSKGERNWTAFIATVIASILYIIHHSLILFGVELMILIVLTPIIVWAMMFVVAFSGRPLLICVDARDIDGNYIKINAKEGAINIPAYINPFNTPVYFKEELINKLYVSNPIMYNVNKPSSSSIGTIEMNRGWKIEYQITQDKHIFVYLSEFIKNDFQHERWAWQEYNVCPNRNVIEIKKYSTKYIKKFKIPEVSPESIDKAKQDFIDSVRDLREQLNQKIIGTS
ncbi:MAG: hypothetical protein ACFFAT_21685 [Promethearchaeota archaeon]